MRILQVVTGGIDGITVNSWFNPGQEAGNAVAAAAAQTLKVFNEVLWPYPYVEMSCCRSTCPVLQVASFRS